MGPTSQSIRVTRDDLAAVVADQRREDTRVGALLDEMDRAIGEDVVGAAGVERVDLVVAAVVGVLVAAVAVGVELAAVVGPAGARALVVLGRRRAVAIPRDSWRRSCICLPRM